MSMIVQAKIKGVHTKTVRSCSWSPSGHLLAIASFDGKVSIWNKTETCFKFWYFVKDTDEDSEDEGAFPDIIYEEPDAEEPEDEESDDEASSDKDVSDATLPGVESVSWDDTGAHLATSIDNSICIWRVGNEHICNRIAELVKHSQDIKMVQWHPSKNILFSCSHDNSIKVWPRNGDFDEWYIAQTLHQANKGHSATVWSISFNATGNKMVTSSADLSIKVWERMQSRHKYESWEHLQTLSGNHDGTIFSVHWSSKGIIASGAADGAICLFQENQDGLGKKNTMLAPAKVDPTVKCRDTWSPMEIGLLASSSDDGTIKIWTLTSHQ